MEKERDTLKASGFDFWALEGRKASEEDDIK